MEYVSTHILYHICQEEYVPIGTNFISTHIPYQKEYVLFHIISMD